METQKPIAMGKITPEKSWDQRPTGSTTSVPLGQELSLFANALGKDPEAVQDFGGVEINMPDLCTFYRDFRIVDEFSDSC